MELKQLEQMLMDEQVEVRLEAARRFSRLETFDEGLFVRMLGDADWRVRKEAVSLFLRLPDAGTRTAKVIEQLRHPENAGLRNAAIEILISLGAQGTPELIRQLKISDAEVRKFIVDILGEIGHPGCVAQLLPFLQDEDENVRYAVVETLGKLRADAAVSGLLDLLETADAGLRFTIFDALAVIGASVPMERILPYSSDRLLRKAVFYCLGQIGDLRALPALMDGLSDPMRKTREVALMSVGSLLKDLEEGTSYQDIQLPSAERLAQVAEYLEQDNTDFKQAACRLLSLQLDKDLFLRLLPLLAEEELRPTVVAAARRAPEGLLKTLLETTSLQDPMAIFLIYLAGELQSPAVTPLAMQAITDDDPQLRYASVMTLGKVAAFEAIGLLGERLGDDISDIREAASEALRQLGRIDASAVIVSVTPSFDSEQAALRLLAVRTLGGLDSPEAEDYLLQAIKDVAPEVRCEALRSLKGGRSQRLLTGLSIALTDENADVRRLAAAALGAFPAGNGLAVLEHVLDDRDPWVRTVAIRSLQGENLKAVLPLLERGLADPVGVVVIAALETLAEVFPQGAQDYLQQALENADLDVVRKAVVLLLQAGSAELLLSHQKPQVRMAAVAEIQLQQPDEWQQLFEQRLVTEQDPTVRQAMDEALRRGTSGV